MTRTEYLAALEIHLKTLPETDYKEALDYFEEYFEEAGPENEAQVIEELGNPKEAAEEIIRSLLSETDEKDTRSHQEQQQHSSKIEQQTTADSNLFAENYADISEVHIKATSRDILIEPSPDAFFHIHHYNGKNSSKIDSTVRDGKWYITEKNGPYYSGLDWIINVMKNGFDNSPICIQIPRSAVLLSFSLQAASGDVDISYLQALKAEIELTSGDLTLQHCQLQQGILSLISGDLDIEHSRLSNSNLSLVSGDCDAHSLEIAGAIVINATNGDVSLQLLSHDFSYSLETVNGDVDLADHLQMRYQVTGSSIHHQSTTAADSLVIQTVNGDIELY